MKRLLDLVISIPLLLVFTPLMVLICLLIHFQMGSPVFFKQKRPGLNGKPFYLYKFRTMSHATDAQGMLLSDEERLTAFGVILRKYSLDELPQLINVVKGQMSIVGPRPLLMEYLELYTTEQAKRHNVKPGITGWAQVNGRNDVTWEYKFKCDIWYIENHNFLLDLKIIYMTIFEVSKAQGINMEGQSTTEYFNGKN
ncbi:sugar transferase [Halobacillus sp. BBL2006]|uniref:sugar transferase n=1 Tax=Halobacillus sp. BBL2006 TaxID=1543706 RepID=UPI00054364FA|nr:sugar transferase [Halobacillus sp. BBL2006]KHE69243.1 sugar transferase [Halobacillus sp. BBL2006]